MTLTWCRDSHVADLSPRENTVAPTVAQISRAASPQLTHHDSFLIRLLVTPASQPHPHAPPFTRSVQIASAA